jgi:lipoprotein-anchoring transpeptidase ErfK/SrfK
MKRYALAFTIVCAGLGAQTPLALAQDNWWAQAFKPSAPSYGSSSSRSSSNRGSRASAQGSSYGFGSGSSIFGSSDPEPSAAPRSPYQYPAQLEGGARPNISPSAPQSVAFRGFETGSIVVDTQGRALYYVLSSTSAYRYPISVGRDGFTWRGTEKISRVAAWPDWRPPAEMRQRDPRLPEVMTGGVNNPLGAKALYLGNSLYRIHGTNDSRTIGYAASSGCFRMMNQHVMHLATLAGPGTTVRVLDRLPSNVADGGDAVPVKAKARRAAQG